MKPNSKPASFLTRPEKFKRYSSYEFKPFEPGVWVRVAKGPFTDWSATVVRQVTAFHSPFGMVEQRGIVILLSDGTEVGPYMPDELLVVC